MEEQTRLSNLILVHWRTYCPAMVADLERGNRLNETLTAAQERATDLLHEMITVHKMDYRQAWEEAMSEVLLKEESSSN